MSIKLSAEYYRNKLQEYIPNKLSILNSFHSFCLIMIRIFADLVLNTMIFARENIDDS